MTDPLLTSLRRHFGFPAFRPGQHDALQHLLAGRHALVVMPTGAGKSLIYQLAALHLPGVTLVVSPLVALMKDQVDNLMQRGLPATTINSLLPGPEQTRRLDALIRGEVKLMYVAPERFRQMAFMRALRRVRVSLLAVDEAHCISEWGHDFRPDYLRLRDARQQMGQPITVALTATATPQVQTDILDQLGLPDATRLVTGFNRPNLVFEVQSTPDLPTKLTALQRLLGEVADGGVIIYTGTRQDAEEVAAFVRSLSRPAEAYHAGLDPDTRTAIQDRFMSGALGVVAATNAFGMGIDRLDVRLVVHFSVPSTLEAYYQEAGRAGRDGEPSRAVLLYAPQDRAQRESLMEQDSPSHEDLEAVYRAIQAEGQSEVWLTAEDLSLITGLASTKVRVALGDLERSLAVVRLGDDGVGMLLRVGAWDDQAVRRVEEGRRQHERQRRRALDHMLAYAETSACRRRLMLDHFGDASPAEASACCDNCLARQPVLAATLNTAIVDLTPAERAALAILDAVRRLRWGIGREKLALLLKGSKAREMQVATYREHIYYARLAPFSLAEIEGLIAQLVNQGYLKVVGSTRPVLKLTPLGEQAIKTKARIALDLPRPYTPRHAPDHIQPTHHPLSTSTPTVDNTVTTFLATPHARPLTGPWKAGWALDVHSRFSGAEWDRSAVGQLAYQFKYQADRAALPSLVDHTLKLMEQHPELRDAQAIVPVPPSAERDFNPVGELAAALSQRLEIPTWPALVKTRATKPQKELRTLAQKRANVAGAFAVRGPVRGRRLLVVDDLYDSGATLEEVTRVLLAAAVEAVYVLTLTHTIHTDA